MKFSELKCKEVINCRTGCRLGFITDLEFCEKNGQIQCFFVPKPSKFFSWFCSDEVLIIPFCKIVRIGPDVIIVDLEEKPDKKK